MEMNKAIFMLSRLSDEDVEWMLAVGNNEVVPDGTCLIAESAALTSLYIVLDGEVSISSLANDGVEFARRGVGEVMGEISFVDQRNPTATVTAAGEVKLYSISRDALADKLGRDAAFSGRFFGAIAAFLSERLREATLGRPEEDGPASPDTAISPEILVAQSRFDRLMNRLRRRETVIITGNDLVLEDIVAVAMDRMPVQLSDGGAHRLEQSRAVVDRLAAGPPVYGLNTGLGALKDQRISGDQISLFQQNIIKSHATGVGPAYRTPVVRAIMLARLNGMARGGAGVSPRCSPP